MIKKRKGGAGGDDAPLDGPAPEPASPGAKKKSRKSKPVEENGTVTITRAELDAMNDKLASSSAQIELYQFQIKKLREDLDHIKLHSVLTNLGGPVVISEERTPTAAHAEVAPEPAADEIVEEAALEIPPVTETAPVDDSDESSETIETADTGGDDATAAEEPAEEVDMESVRANFFACFETIATMSKMYGEACAELKKKDTLIELLKERIELQAQSSESETVPVEQYNALVTQIEEVKNSAAASLEEMKARLEDETRAKEEAIARAESDEASLKDALDRADATVAELKETEEKLRREVEELTSRIEAYAREREQGENEVVASLQKENDELRAAKKSLEDEIEGERNARESQVAEIRARLEESERAAAGDAAGKIASLEQTGALLAARIAELEKYIEEESRMHAGELLNAQKRLDDMTAARDEDERQAAERMKFHTDRLKAEHEEILAAVEAREEEALRLGKEISNRDAEISRLKKENFALMSRLEATRVKAAQSGEKDFAGTRERLLERFSKDGAPATLLELRSLFISSRKYEEAVRTFRKLLIEPGNQKFMPAVCLLVGEFYNLAGRSEEGAFYLANPLIRDDAYARQLLDVIDSRRTSD